MITVITLPSSIPVRKPLNKNKDMYTLDIISFTWNWPLTANLVLQPYEFKVLYHVDYGYRL